MAGAEVQVAPPGDLYVVIDTSGTAVPGGEFVDVETDRGVAVRVPSQLYAGGQIDVPHDDWRALGPFRARSVIPRTPEDSTSPVADLEREKAALQAEGHRLADEHRQEHQAIIDRIREVEHRQAMAEDGVPPDVLALAMSVIAIRGDASKAYEQSMDAAIQAVADGGRALVDVFIGAKFYDGFGQRCDCKYGMGPKHGSIVFAVELTDDARRRVRGIGLTDAERDAAVRWLRAEQRAHPVGSHRSRWT